MSLTFRMYADIRFNRPIDKENDYISPGGYEMKMAGKNVRFDFEESSCGVDKYDDCLLLAELKNPDYSYIEVDGESGEITEEMLMNVEDIKEFFVFTGEDDETDLKPIAVEGITFVLPYDNWKNIEVKKEICKAAKVCSNIE